MDPRRFALEAVGRRPLDRPSRPSECLAACGPTFSASSQNTTRIPRTGAENGTKPTLTASVIGKSSEKS